MRLPRRRTASGSHESAGLASALPRSLRPPLALLVAMAVALGTPHLAVAKKLPPAPEPPALPAGAESLGALGLHAALDASVRAQVDDGQRVVTFAEQQRSAADGVEMIALSLGVLRLPPESLRSLLGRVSGYPTWLTLQPSYKSARVEGASRLIVGVGSADAPKAKRTMIYDVTTAGDISTWRVLESGTALKAGSLVSFEVVPHPSLPGASLVLHRQVGLLPEAGRMTNYLADDDDRGQNRWWKDANRHARRLHWAFDAALRFPPGADRNGLYIEHHQREFAGKIPYWAAAR